MSISVPPPEFQFNGLIYNPEWWISTSVASGALTQAVANTLYLRKTTTDSASALETFNAGIKSSGYDTITAGATQNMFTTQTANTNLFGNMGAGQTLKLGNQTTAQSVHCSFIDLNGTTINNAISPAVGALSIGNSQTSGVLNLGTNVGRTGNINIGGVGSTGKLNFNRPLTIAYSIAPVSGDIGFRENISALPTQITNTIGIINTEIMRFTSANGNQQAIGSYIYEFRFNISTISLANISISTVGATTMDGNFQVTQNTTTAVATFGRITTVQSFNSLTDMWVVGISNVPATIGYAMIRTRIG
jgi:hypothetical protein